MSAEPSTAMTGKEREQLAKIVRLNERVAKAVAKQRGAALRAEFETQISARYSFNQHELWKAAHAVAEAAAITANEQIAEACRELGIPKEFAPSVGANWYSRGENSVAKRRDELRKAAVARIEENYRSAVTTIGARSAEVQTQLLIGGLTSTEARAFVESIPSPEALMPVVKLVELEGGQS